MGSSIGIIAGAAAATSAAWMAWAVRGRSASVFGQSVWRGAGDRLSIALTFDDGPSESTPRLLEILARYQVRATFFQCGAHADRLPGIAREVSAAGHEIGNHTQNHARLYLRTPGFIREEVTSAQVSLSSAHGFAPRLFRAPYGCRWFGLGKVQRDFDLLGVMWTTIARDWSLTPGRIVQRLLDHAEPGAIFCLHDGRNMQRNPDIRNTLTAVSAIVPCLMDQGYTFETVSEILCPTNSSSA